MKTKRIPLLLLLTAMTFVGCGRHPESEPDYQDPAYRWSADFSQPGEDLLVRGQKMDSIKDNLQQLIYAINGSDLDPESFRTPQGQEPMGLPKLKLINHQGNQAVVEVINAPYLTHRMGSTGADTFLAEATFTITEHPEIDWILFQFEEGDHASPGRYNRDRFTNHWKAVEN